MTLRSTLSLLVAIALLGLSWADSMEEQFYRSAQGPALDESAEQQRQARDSWKKLATDMVSYMGIFSSSTGAIEHRLKELSEKVDRELELGNRENYSMHYFKQLLSEQRAVIDALRSGVSSPTAAASSMVETTKKIPSFDEVLQKTEQFVRPLKSTPAASKDPVTKELSAEHEKLILALQNLQGLKI